MGIYRLDGHGCTCLQEVHQLGKLLGHETEPVHACVELDMDREAFESPLFEHVAEDLERIHVRDARLQTVVHDLFERVGAGRKDHYRRLYACLTELYALDGIGHGKVIRSRFFHE